jgi:imidazolonepropionase-like amidohydrolase
MAAQRASFRAAVEAGVPIAMGTDAVGYPQTQSDRTLCGWRPHVTPYQ